MDVKVTRSFAAGPERVAAIMFDPARDPEWIGGARSVDPPSRQDLQPGTRVQRHGGFLGKSFSWTTEVREHVPDRILRMTVVEGPMQGAEVCYQIAPAGDGSIVSIRNSGSASFAFPGMAWFLRRSVGKDLDRLRGLVGGG